MTESKILACLLVTGGFIWALVLGELIFSLLYKHSKPVRNWVGQWDTDDEWEDEK